MEQNTKDILLHLNKLSVEIEQKLNDFNLDKAIKKHEEWQNMSTEDRVKSFAKEWEERMKQYR